MFEELVQQLRACIDENIPCEKADCGYKPFGNEDCVDNLMRRAADAIEKMSRRETPMKIIEIHVDEYYCPACGAENNCDQGYVQDAYCPACGQRFLLELPKENGKSET